MPSRKAPKKDVEEAESVAAEQAVAASESSDTSESTESTSDESSAEEMTAAEAETLTAPPAGPETIAKRGIYILMRENGIYRIEDVYKRVISGGLETEDQALRMLENLNRKIA